MKQPIVKFPDTKSEDEIAQQSSLFLRTQAGAIEEITNTLLEYRIYCGRKKLKFLAYLIEMAALEALDVQTSLSQATAKTTHDAGFVEPTTSMETNGGNHD